MSKKSKTTENSTTNQLTTSTPTVAPWLDQNYQTLGGQIANFGKTDPTSYVAGPSALQTQGFGQAANLGGWRDLLSQAGAGASQVAGAGANLAAPTATYGGASLLDGGLDRYMNAGLNDVVSSSLANFDYSTGREKAAMDAKSALNKSFNNTRSVFGETQFAADSARQRSATEADLRFKAFQEAAGLASQDAQFRQQAGLTNAGAVNQGNQFNAGQQDSALARQLQAAGLMGQFADATGNQGRADLSAVLQAGGQQQAIEQAKLNALPTWLQQLTQLNGSIPIGAFTSTTGTGQGSSNSTSTSKTSDPMGALGSLASLAGTFATGLPMFGMGSQLAGAGAALSKVNPALDAGFGAARYGTVGAG